jgi:hypothetical protein
MVAAATGGVVLFALGLGILTYAAVAIGWDRATLFHRILAVTIALVGLLLAAFSLLLALRPRLVFEDGCLVVYLRAGNPIRVPIDVVQAFLLGQSPSWLSGEKHRRTETVTLVIRLAERAAEWSHRDVDPRLGSWCDGYITIRGTWCQPLTVGVADRLNRRLHEVTQQQARQ